MNKHYFLIIIGFLAVIMNTEARWAEPEDAAYQYHVYNEHLTIDKDGLSSSVIELQKEVIKEYARESAAKFALEYCKDFETIEVLDAYTIFHGQKFQVESDRIEDKPIASSGLGFDHKHQLTLSFPKAEIGAQVYLKIKIKIHKPFIEEYMDHRFNFGHGGYYKQHKVTIDSKVPLYLQVNDPTDILSVETDMNKKGEFFHGNFAIKKPFIRDIVGEVGNGSVNTQYYTWALISTDNQWQSLVHKLAWPYKKVINQKLPEMFKQIAEQAKVIKSELDQINIVTSNLQHKIQYFGEWKGYGSTRPRDLDVVVKTQLGDCKDFAASTAAIMQNLGYKAQVILVKRYDSAAIYRYQLPYISFNHAMVKLTSPQGKIYWIDPTNPVSMSDGIFPDVAGRMSLVLDPNDAQYEQIPEIDFNRAKKLKDTYINIGDNGLVHTKLHYLAEGEVALNFTGAELYSSKESIENWLYNNIDDIVIDKQHRIHSSIPELTSRIVKPVTLTLEYNNPNKLFYTNYGQAFHINNASLNHIMNISEDNAGDLYIGHPISEISNIIIKNHTIKNANYLNIQLSTPWLDITRSCHNHNNDTIITDHIVIKTQFIANEELRSEEYKKLRSMLLRNIRNVAVIL